MSLRKTRKIDSALGRAQYTDRYMDIYNIIACMRTIRPVHNTILNNALRCVVFTSTLIETQHDARIDSNPILAFPCIAFLHLVIKKPPTFLAINLCVSRINAMQGLASLCEPAYTYACVCNHTCVHIISVLAY